MAYKVEFSDFFLEDIELISENLYRKLKSDNTTKKLLRKIQLKIEQLSNSPKMYPKISKIGRWNREFRKIVLDNYILLYTIDEDCRKVYISYIFYNKRNYFDIPI